MSLRTALRFFSGSILLILLAGGAAVADQPKIAVIIDDVGNQLDAGRRSIALSGPVALAILPHTPYAQVLAEEGSHRGKEILVHMPMQASHADADPGPGALSLDHADTEVAKVLARAIAAVPHATGVSNHMGSLLTRDSAAMRAFMKSLAGHDGMFFVDSYTTHLSVGLMTARQHGIRSLKRDVFLDANPRDFDAQWRRLLAMAKDFGFAIAIAHPYAQSLAELEQRIATLQDIELVSPSVLLVNDHFQQSYAELIGYAPTSDFLLRSRMH